MSIESTLLRKLEEVSALIITIPLFFHIIVRGHGDMSYSARRNLLSAISIQGKIAYHLFNIEYSSHKSNYNVKLLRKSKWHPQNNTLASK